MIRSPIFGIYLFIPSFSRTLLVKVQSDKRATSGALTTNGLIRFFDVYLPFLQGSNLARIKKSFH